MKSTPYTLLLTLIALAFVFNGCNDEETGTNTTCELDECIECAGPDICPTGLYCPDEGGFCQPGECTPGETQCTGDALRRCQSDGRFDEGEACASGVCTGGQCGCAGAEDCASGEDCTNGVCACASGVTCGDTGVCCGDGESCELTRVCDHDENEESETNENCETLFQCQPECTGSICGARGELCCEGSTPECSPTGQCAPACEDLGLGALCGEDFDQCCPQGDVCVFGACATPGQACTDFLECDFGEYCDEGLGRCMPDDFPDELTCRLDGNFQAMEITEKWSWQEEDIISIPVVGDVTGDGAPNVVINTTIVNQWTTGFIVILNADGTEHLRIPHDPDNDSWGSQGRSNIALGDVSGDGVLDIIYASRASAGKSTIVAATGQGETIWRSHDENNDLVSVTVVNGAITVTELDGDPSRVEIVFGAMLIDSDGLVHWNQNGDGPRVGSNSGYIGGVASVADLTGDGKQEILTGRFAWTVTWDANGAAVEPLWTHDGPDGYTAIADIDGDGLPEVLLVGNSTLRILNGQTGELFCGVDPTDQACQNDPSLRTAPIALPGSSSNNRGGPPTVADFDRDGRPEIGVAGGYFYAVFDLHRPGFGLDDTAEEIDPNLLAAAEQDAPNEGALFVRWRRATQDLSSNATGSSVFDFQGDGAASVVYSDECFMRVYSGLDGQVELELPNSTGTILEYPIIVDVDKNGRSEILVVANSINHCSNVPGYTARKGLYVYEDPNDRWVRTRSVWNQHAYFIDNILDDGTVPTTPVRHWETHNTYRNNRQGEIPLNSADVVVTAVQTNPGLCPPNLVLSATIQNLGTAGIPAGLPISLIFSDTGDILRTLTLAQPLSPGGTTTITFDFPLPMSLYNRDIDLLVVANLTADEEAFVPDCNPEQATYLVEDVRCDIQN